MQRFDRVIVADWSAASALSPARPSADAIWLCSIDAGRASTSYHRSRARAVWAWLAQHIQDAPDNRNNRFQIAAQINRQFATAASNGPFWGRPASLNLPDLPPTKSIDYDALRLSERRAVETLVPRAQPVWKLYTTGAAGSQGLMGQPMIHRLSQRPQVAVWPFEPPAQITLAEVYPSLIAAAVRADTAQIKDEAQVRLLATALFSLSQQNRLAALLDTPACAEEGWILGAGHTAALLAALT